MQREGTVYVWRCKPQMPGAMDRKGQLCRVLVRGGRNSALIEFADGVRYVVSRNGLRRTIPNAPDSSRARDESKV